MEQGYGIDYTQIKWKDDAQEKIGALIDKTTYIKEQYEEYCDDMDKDSNAPDSRIDFVENYINDTYLWDGEIGLLCDIINEVEFKGETIFRIGDYCLYVAAYIPANKKDQANLPTQEDIRKILCEYFNPLIKEFMTIQWFEIRD